MNTHYLKSVFWRLLIIFSLPISALFQPTWAGKYAEYILLNQNEAIFGLCLLCLAFGVITGTFYPSPEDTPKNLPLWLKFIISISGGILAFIYVLHNDKQLTILNPIWVWGVSFLFPAVIEILRSAGIDRTRELLRMRQSQALPDGITIEQEAQSNSIGNDQNKES